MGVVIDFPHERTRLGKKPRGHVAPKYGPRGRVLMARGQVWVEGHNQRLWVIGHMAKSKKRKGNLYPHDVTLVAYRGNEERTLAEASVRLSMEVWEVYLVEHELLMKKLAYASEHSPQSPFRGQKDAKKAALNFFGLDVQGNRID